MKIGILTYHAALNCGSMLQAFALQQVIKDRSNADVEIINYSNKGQRQFYSNWDTKLRPRIIKSNIKNLPKWRYINQNREDYQRFSKKYLKLSGPLLKKYSDLEAIESRYDIIIAGGDQIWNVKCRDADKAYFLPFVKNAIKVSYSPSLGSIPMLNNINKEEYAKYIESFDFASVREPNGKKWVEEVANVDLPIVLDPTFLLRKNEWEEKISIPEMNEEFIFYYGFDFENERNNHLLQNISKKLNLPIYIMDRKSYHLYNLERFGFVLSEPCGPEGFINLMENAKLVIARSFHGIAFSIIFNKNFWTIRNKQLANPNDDRSRNILGKLGLEDRLQIIDELDQRDLFEEINYKDVEEKLEMLRQQAYKYIDSFLSK